MAQSGHSHLRSSRGFPSACEGHAHRNDAQRVVARDAVGALGGGDARVEQVLGGDIKHDALARRPRQACANRGGRRQTQRVGVVGPARAFVADIGREREAPGSGASKPPVSVARGASRLPSSCGEASIAAAPSRATEKAPLPTGSGGAAVTTTVSTAWPAAAAANEPSAARRQSMRKERPRCIPHLC